MPDSAMASSTSANRSFQTESPTIALFRSAIGPVNIEYYLPLLTRFESLGQSTPSWNWAAGLYTLNWMVYRRLWRHTVLYLAALIFMWASAAIIQLIAKPSLPTQFAGMLTLLSLSIGIPGFLGNAWLYIDIRKRMTQAIANSKTMAEAGLVLSQQASTRQGFIRQLIANAAIVGVAVVGYLLVPASEKESTGEVKPAKTVTKVTTPPALTAPSLPTISAASIALAASAAVPAIVAASAPSVAASASASPPALTAASAPLLVAAPLQTPLPKEGPQATIAPIPKTKIKSYADLVESSKLPKKQEKKEPVGTTTAPAPRTVYYVNVGLFSKEQNATAAIGQLAAAGMTGTTQSVDVGSKTLTRVRSGPFETRADATEAAVKIRLLNLEAKVHAHRQP